METHIHFVTDNPAKDAEISACFIVGNSMGWITYPAEFGEICGEIADDLKEKIHYMKGFDDYQMECLENELPNGIKVYSYFPLEHNYHGHEEEITLMAYPQW